MMTRRLFQCGVLILAVCVISGLSVTAPVAASVGANCVSAPDEDVPDQPGMVRKTGSCWCVDSGDETGNCETLSLRCALQAGVGETNLDGPYCGPVDEGWGCICSYSYIWYR